MRKRILTIFAFLLIAFGSLTIYSLINLSRVNSTLEKVDKIQSGFYSVSEQLMKNVQNLDTLIAQFFVFSEIEDLTRKKDAAEGLFQEIEKNIKSLNSPHYSSILNLEMQKESNNADIKINNEIPPQAQARAIKVYQAVKNLSTLYDSTHKEFGSVASAIMDISRTKRDSEENYTKMSKYFRKINFNIEKSDRNGKKAYSNLLRSVIVVSFSRSVRDLNFAGRKKFEESTKYFDLSSINQDENYTAFKQYFEQCFDAAIKIAANTSDKSYEAFLMASSGFNTSVRELKEFSKMQFERSQKNAIKTIETVNAVNLPLSVVVILLGSVIVWYTINQLTRSIRISNDSMMIATKNVTETTPKILSASSSLSDGVQNQASSLQQTAASLTEIHSMIAKTADASQNSSALATTSLSAAKAGQNAVMNMNDAIKKIEQSNNDISTEVMKSNEKTLEITKVIESISEKTKVINDIVFQTKLLSFNASVEAARAGNHGKGFAVVAEEIGNLAAMSGVAANEISHLLDASVRDVSALVNQSSLNIKKVISESKIVIDSGIQTVEVCDKELKDISKSVEELNDLIQEIAEASKEQTKGVEEITKAVSSLEKINLQTAEIAKGTKDLSKELKESSSQLESSAKDLSIIIKKGKANTIFKEQDNPVILSNSQLNDINRSDNNTKDKIAA